MPVSFRDLVALTKPRLSSLVMITAGGGMFLAPGHIDPLRATIALFATSGIVGAANALNCYWERDLDRYMSRTRTRPLPAGRLEPWIALVVAAALALFAIPALLLAVNAVTSALALLALATYVLVYTPLKQKSPAALWAGAIPGAIPPLMGWTAVRGRIELPGVVLFGILFLWQLPHSIAIAIYRKDDYAAAGHRVLPLVVSDRALRFHIVFWTALLFPVTLMPTFLGITGYGYLAVAGLLGGAFLAQAGTAITREQLDAGWAKKLFLASLVYLTVLFAALIIDAR